MAHNFTFLSRVFIYYAQLAAALMANISFLNLRANIAGNRLPIPGLEFMVI